MTDIHGDARAMRLLLEEIDWGCDQLVFGGDMIDRGTQSGEVLRDIKQLCERYPGQVRAVAGNHEEMMRDYRTSGDRLWLHHGGRETLQQLQRTFPDEDEREAHIQWACSLPLVLESARFVYTHAGIDPYDALDAQSREIVWMEEGVFYRYPKQLVLERTGGRAVVHGHTPVERLYFDGARLNGDLGSNTYPLVEERGLGLINLTNMSYVLYRPHSGKMERRRIGRL